ncbi:hypothetical protein M1N87_01455 [Dehalococcoidia bacterium]|nr:hypothetical protein [Dehalococcoidia bacterium]
MAYCTPLIFSPEVHNPDMQQNALLFNLRVRRRRIGGVENQYAGVVFFR